MRSWRSIPLAGAALLALLLPSRTLACYGIVVGREASADGSVLVGHNEQSAALDVRFRRVPRLQHPAGATATLDRGGTLPEVPETYAYLWSEHPPLDFSDAYLNEYGVAIVGSACPSREEQGQTQDGGIGYMLRRLIAQRAASAREGVALAGELLARFGYWSNGRTYIVADPREAWVLSIVQGNHWVAQRVPDDQVALLPNVYTITEVDLGDPANFLGSPDLVEYAVERGWYDPASGQPFRFRSVYADGEWIDPRQHVGQRLVTGQEPDPATAPLPFSVRPDHPLIVAEIAAILRDEELNNVATAETRVFQLRHWLPPAIGCVYWRTSAEPGTGLLLPWYLGITETPAYYYPPVGLDEQLALEHHFARLRKDLLPMAWLVFRTFQDVGSPILDSVRPLWDEFEANAYARQARVEAEAQRLFAEAPESASAYLTRYSARQSLEALELTRYMTEAVAHGAPLPDIALSARVAATEMAPAIARAGTATSLSVSLVLEPLPGPLNNSPRLSLDLSALGLPAPVPLIQQEEGRFAATVNLVPERNGRYAMFILAQDIDGQQRGLRAGSLDVYPAGDLGLFADRPAGGWVWRTQGKTVIDTAAATPVYEGQAALGIQSTGIMTVQAEAAQPVSSIGIDTLCLAVYPGETKPLGLSVGANNRVGRDLAKWVNWDEQRWQRVAIPLDSLRLKEPWEEIRSFELKGRLTGSLWIDEVRLIAALAPLPPTLVQETFHPALPVGCALAQNYPNPFNHGTVVGFSLPRTETVELVVYNLAGQQVAELASGARQAGRYTVHWDGRDDQGQELASGVYLYRLKAGAQEETRKLLLLR